MPQISGGHLVARALRAEGVSHLFTLCGSHIQQIYDGCVDERITVIDTRHEQAAAHAADGWSRVTRGCGVAAVTAGPGVTDAVTALANAYQAGSPMLLIGGRSPLRQFEMGALQEMDHVELVRPVTKWARLVVETQRIPEYVSIAFRHALSGRRGPVFLEIPTDVLGARVEESDVLFPEKYRTTARTYGDVALVEEAAALLAQAKSPMVIAGSSIYWCNAHEQLRQLVEKAQVPVYLNGLGRGCIPPDHPNFFAATRRGALALADAILIIGTPLDFRLGYGREPTFPQGARVIQIDVDATDIGRNRPIDVGIVGDVDAVLTQLSEALSERSIAEGRQEWLGRLRRAEEQHREQRQAALHSDQVPIHPYRLCYEMSQVVTPDTICVGDGGDIVAEAASVLPISQPGHWVDPGPFGCLGVGTGFAMAAKAAYPDKPVLIINGDGSFGLNGMEFDTLVRFGLPVVSVVGNDAMWGQVRRPQVRLFGEERSVGTALTHARYDLMVQGLGGHGEYVERPEDIRPALERAFASGLPACVNVKIDASPVREPRPAV